MTALLTQAKQANGWMNWKAGLVMRFSWWGTNKQRGLTSRPLLIARCESLQLFSESKLRLGFTEPTNCRTEHKSWAAHSSRSLVPMRGTRFPWPQVNRAWSAMEISTLAPGKWNPPPTFCIQSHIWITILKTRLGLQKLLCIVLFLGVIFLFLIGDDSGDKVCFSREGTMSQK